MAKQPVTLVPVAFDPFGPADTANESVGVSLSPVDFDPFTINGTTDEGRMIVDNGDGSYSTERTITVQNPKLNGGRWTNIPSMFGGVQVSEEEAVQRIVESGGIDPETGRQLIGFDNLQDAEKAAQGRTSDLGKYAQKLTPVDFDPFGDAAPAANYEEVAKASEQFKANTPWTERRTDDLRRGAHNLASGWAAQRAADYGMALSAFDAIDTGAESGSTFDAQIGAAQGKYGLAGYDVTKYTGASPEKRQEIRAEIVRDFNTKLQDHLDHQQASGAIPQTPAARAAAEADGWKEMFKYLGQDPMEVIQSVFTESLPMSAPSMIMGLASVRGSGGPSLARGAGGAGFGSYSVENIMGLTEALQNAGVDTSSPEAIREAFQNPDTVEKAREASHKHAVPVALFDALTFGIAGKSLTPFKGKFSKPISNLGAQTIVQGAGGAAGEAIGQDAAGYDLQPFEIAAEALAEGPSAIIEVPGVAMAMKNAPTGKREAAAAETPPLSEADRASPIPDELIQKGKSVLADGDATQSANDILRGAGIPTVNTPVSVQVGDKMGRGRVADAFDDPAQGVGVKIAMEDGSTFSAPLSDIQSGHVQVATETMPMGTKKGDVGAHVGMSGQEERFVASADVGTIKSAAGEDITVLTLPGAEQGAPVHILTTQDGNRVAIMGADSQAEAKAIARENRVLGLDDPAQVEDMGALDFKAMIEQKPAPTTQDAAAGQTVKDNLSPTVSHETNAEQTQQPFNPEAYGAAVAYARQDGKKLTPLHLAKALNVSGNEARILLNALAGKGVIRVTNTGKYQRIPVRKGPVDVLTYIADRGGVRDDEGHDLKKGRNGQRLIPGVGALIRKDGHSVDAIGEMLWEEGYFGPVSTVPRPSEADILEMLDRAWAGEKVYRPEEAHIATEAMAEEERKAAVSEARARVTELGLDLNDGELEQVAGYVDQGVDLDDAIAATVEQGAAQWAETYNPAFEDDAIDIPWDEIMLTEPADLEAGIRYNPPSVSDQLSGKFAAKVKSNEPRTAPENGQADQEGSVKAREQDQPESQGRGAEARPELGKAGGPAGQASPGVATAQVDQAPADNAGVSDSGPDSIVDDDGEVHNAKAAFFGESHLRFARDDKGVIRLLGVWADPEGSVRGRSMVRWLRKEYPDSRIVVDEAAPDALGFWGKMEDEGLVDAVNAEKFDGNTVSLDHTTETVTNVQGATEQGVIPGAEKITDKELAERKMEGPKKATKPQKDVGSDGGLFDTGARDQSDMFDAKPRATKSVVDQKQPETQDKIEDFGEVLQGARKHYAEEYASRMAEAEDLDVAAEPLSKTWPEPQYDKLIEDGTDPWIVAFVHAARDEIPNKPRQGWKLKQYVAQVEALRGFSNDLLGGKIEKAALQEKLNTKEYSRLKGALETRVDLYQVVGHGKSLKGVRISVGSYSLYGGVEYSPPKTIWSVEKKAKATAFSNWPRQLAIGATRDEAIANFKKAYSSLEINKPASKEIKFDVYSYRRESNKVYIGKKVGSDYIDLQSFESTKEARAYLTDHYDDLVKQLERKKFVPEHRMETNEPRVGEDHRNGADATPDMFMGAFGFRGVQFGNYVENAKRQQDLNDAYDGLMDLAGILGIPSRALSLNGTLGLAFGARGKGGKRAPKAHYETGNVVINLTKRDGAGSLAHEWWHSLDNYFSRARNDKGGYLTDKPYDRGPGVRPEMVRAFDRVMKAIGNTGLRKRAAEIDKRRTKVYWSTPLEMSARSFESYVIAKLQDQSAKNDYLANIVSEGYWKAAEALGVGEGVGEQVESYPYLKADEVPAVRAAFDEFFNTIETRETDTGVEMYSLHDGKSQTLDTYTWKDSEARQALVKEVKKIHARIAPKTDLKLVDEVFGTVPGKGRVRITGAYRGAHNLVEVAIDYGNPEVTVRHEGIHALKAMDLFTRTEWSILSGKARREWIGKYNIERLYSHATKEDRIEEAIAQAYAEYAAGNSTVPSGIRRIFDKIKQFIERLRNALKGLGFQSVEDIFDRVEVGEVGKRDNMRNMNDRFAYSLEEKPTRTPWPEDFPPVQTHMRYEEFIKHPEYRAAKDGDVDAAFRLVEAVIDEKVVERIRKIVEGLDPIVASVHAEEASGRNKIPLAYADALAERLNLEMDTDILQTFKANHGGASAYHRMAFQPSFGGTVEKGRNYIVLDDTVAMGGTIANLKGYIEEQGGNVILASTLASRGGNREIDISLFPPTLARLRGKHPKLEAWWKEEFGHGLDSLTEGEAGHLIAAPTFDAIRDRIAAARQTEGDPAPSDPAGTGAREQGTDDGGGIDPTSNEDTNGSGNGAVSDSGDKYSLFDEDFEFSAEATLDAVERGKITKESVLGSAIKSAKDMATAPALPETGDINWAQQAILHPRMIAALFPKFTPVWLVAVKQFQRRDTLNAEMTRMLSDYFALQPEQREDVHKVLEIGRLQGEVIDSPIVGITNKLGDAAMTKKGERIVLSKEQSQAYHAVRQAMDRALDLYKQQVLREWGYGKEGDPATAKELEAHARELYSQAKEAESPEEARELNREGSGAMQAADIVAEIERAKKQGYIPFTRFGDIGISVRDSLGALVHFEKIDVGGPVGRVAGRKKVMDARRRLEAQYPRAKGFDVEQARRIVNAEDMKAAGIKIGDVDALAELGRLEGPEWENVRQQLADASKKVGFRKHFIGAKNTPGYSTDFERSIADYVTGISSYLARREVHEEMETAIAGIPDRQRDLVTYAKKYNEYIQSPREVLQWLRSTNFAYYLSGNVSSAVTNMTQVPMVTMPYLTQFTSSTMVTYEMNRAYKDLAKMMIKKPSLDGGAIDFFDLSKAPDDVKEAIQAAVDDGSLIPQVTLEQMGVAHGSELARRGVSKATRTALEFAGSFFTGAERANRIVTFIATYRIAQKSGVLAKANEVLKDDALWQHSAKDMDAANFARWVIDETHFKLGKLNRPRLLRGFGTAAFQFKSFMLNYLELLWRMARLNGPEGKKALVYALGMLLMTTGFWGLPFGEDLKDIIESIYAWAADKDLDLESELRQAMYEMTDSALFAEAVNRGALRITGIDMSHRIDLGNVLPMDTIKALFGQEAQNPSEALGVSYDMLVRRPQRALDHAKNDDIKAAIAELLPQFAANPLKAYGWSTDGVKSRDRGVIPKDEISGFDVAMKALGFTPVSVTRAREKQWATTRAQNAVTGIQGRYYTRLSRAMAQGDRAEVDSVRQEIADYNADRPLNERIILSPGYLKRLVRLEVMGYAGRKVAKKARGRAAELDAIYPD